MEDRRDSSIRLRSGSAGHRPLKDEPEYEEAEPIQVSSYNFLTSIDLALINGQMKSLPEVCQEKLRVWQLVSWLEVFARKTLIFQIRTPAH